MLQEKTTTNMSNQESLINESQTDLYDVDAPWMEAGSKYNFKCIKCTHTAKFDFIPSVLFCSECESNMALVIYVYETKIIYVEKSEQPELQEESQPVLIAKRPKTPVRIMNQSIEVSEDVPEYALTSTSAVYEQILMETEIIRYGYDFSINYARPYGESYEYPQYGFNGKSKIPNKHVLTDIVQYAQTKECAIDYCEHCNTFTEIQRFQIWTKEQKDLAKMYRVLKWERVQQREKKLKIKSIALCIKCHKFPKKDYSNNKNKYDHLQIRINCYTCKKWFTNAQRNVYDHCVEHNPQWTCGSCNAIENKKRAKEWVESQPNKKCWKCGRYNISKEEFEKNSKRPCHICFQSWNFTNKTNTNRQRSLLDLPE